MNGTAAPDGTHCPVPLSRVSVLGMKAAPESLDGACDVLRTGTARGEAGAGGRTGAGVRDGVAGGVVDGVVGGAVGGAGRPELVRTIDAPSSHLLNHAIN